MQRVSLSKYVMLIVLAVLALVGLLVFVLTGKTGTQSEPISEGHQKQGMASDQLVRKWPQKGAETAVDKATVSSGKQVALDHNRLSKIEARKRLAAKNINHLDGLLDQDKRAEAYEYAKKLLKTGIVSERLAAIKALQWLGGRDAVAALLPYLGEDDIMEDTVDETLRSIIEEGLYTDARVMDKEMWLETLKAAGNENSMYVYMTLMSAFPELESVPVLLEMYKSQSPLDRKMAQDFMEFVAQGEVISTAKDAEAWWKKWLQDRGLTEQDVKDYQNSGKGDTGTKETDSKQPEKE